MFQAWEQILAAFNGSQTGGIKSLVELQTKYRNMKLLAKKELSNNAKEIKATGGGQAKLNHENDFGFVKSQISGLANKYDDDFDEENDEYSAKRRLDS